MDVLSVKFRDRIRDFARELALQIGVERHLAVVVVVADVLDSLNAKPEMKMYSKAKIRPRRSVGFTGYIEKGQQKGGTKRTPTNAVRCLNIHRNSCY